MWAWRENSHLPAAFLSDGDDRHREAPGQQSGRRAGAGPRALDIHGPVAASLAMAGADLVQPQTDRRRPAFIGGLVHVLPHSRNSGPFNGNEITGLGSFKTKPYLPRTTGIHRRHTSTTRRAGRCHRAQLTNAGKRLPLIAGSTVATLRAHSMQSSIPSASCPCGMNADAAGESGPASRGFDCLAEMQDAVRPGLPDRDRKLRKVGWITAAPP